MTFLKKTPKRTRNTRANTATGSTGPSPGTEHAALDCWGDGVYPVYFGCDAEGKVCGVYIHFIDVEEEYKDDGGGAEE